MRITRLLAHVVTLPLKRAVRHASHVRTTTENIVVQCELSDGSIGWGEGVPREYVTGESADSAIDLLAAADLVRQCPDCPDFAAAVRLAEAIALPAVPGDDRGCQGNAARCALELAVLDAFGRAFGENFSAVVTVATPNLLKFVPEVRYSGVITSSRGLKLRIASFGYRLTGFRQMKVKVGIAGYDDPTRLKTIRRWAGHGMGVRVDANEAWSPDECAGRIAALEQVGLECVEQPVPHEAVSSLAEVRKSTTVPIMLDESLCSMTDAGRAIDGGWCDRFNLRLSKCGGFIPCLRLAQRAEQAGLSYQLGCQVGESAILSAAGRHFACNVRGLTAIEGSFDRHLMGETLAFEDLTFGRGGRAPALTGSGHGAWVDGDAVARYARRTEAIRV
ncbi:MAG: dipeptide epimerase [Gemmataceae bacterium]|nr:dipeptide epimerase [Gemmataceae bacterium]